MASKFQKNRSMVIQKITAEALERGYIQDKYGNMKDADNKYRIKFKERNVRFERKTSFGWSCIRSKPYSAIKSYIDFTIY